MLNPHIFNPSHSRYEGRWFVSTELAEFTMPPSKIFQEALETLRDFGGPDKEGNSCFTYCQQLAINLDCVPPVITYAVVPEPEKQSWV